MSTKKTIYDIAEEAGVSPTTVSRALSGKGYISPETRDRVLAIAQGFTPRQRGEKTVERIQSYTLGLVVGHSSHYFFANDVYSDIMNGICETATPRGYTLLMDVRNSDITELLNTYEKGKVDGYILLGVKNSNPIIFGLIEAEVPFVLIGDYVDEYGVPPYSKVDIDDFSAAKEATDYLLTLGHKRIGFISHSFEYASSFNRYLGYKSALKESGIECDEKFVVRFDKISEESTINLTKRMLYQSVIPTAIITSNCLISVSVCQAIKECGLSIPKDISVLGFDDSAFAKHYNPPLTTIWQPSEEKGRIATEYLMAAIEKKALPKETVTLPSMIIYRESCCPPPESRTSVIQ